MKNLIFNAVSKIRYFALLMVLTMVATQVWGTLPASPTWTATALGSISDGSTVIIISNSTTATNIALPASGAGTGNPPKKACTVTTTAGVTTITPPTGTTLQQLAWTVKKSGSNYKFYVEGSNTDRLYLTGTSSNTALRVGNASSTNDEFVMGSNGKLLKVSTATRFVGPYDNNGSDWRTYNSETATNYKGAALTFYVLNAAATKYTVTYNGNGNTGGSVPTDATEYSSGATVTVKGNTGSLVKTGYNFGGWNKAADGSGTNYTAGTGTFSISANTTLYAKWTPISYTVTWKVNGTTYTTGSPSTSVNHGSRVSTLPTAPNPASYCGDRFMGWTTVENYDAGSAPTPLFTTAAGAPTASGNQTFYAVFGYWE